MGSLRLHFIGKREASGGFEGGPSERRGWSWLIYVCSCESSKKIAAWSICRYGEGVQRRGAVCSESKGATGFKPVWVKDVRRCTVSARTDKRELREEGGDERDDVGAPLVGERK